MLASSPAIPDAFCIYRRIEIKAVGIFQEVMQLQTLNRVARAKQVIHQKEPLAYICMYVYVYVYMCMYMDTDIFVHIYTLYWAICEIK